MLTKDQKKKIAKDLTEKIKSSKSVVFSNFRGLKVKDLTELKKELRGSNSDFKVAKKNIINIALKDAGMEMDVKGMEGQIAISVSQEDEVSAAKIINKFSKDNENIEITGGLLGSKAMNTEEVKALAKLPGKEELLSQVVGSLKSPLSGIVGVFNGNIRGLVQSLKAIADSKSN